jgi:2-haloacid dehalogenase
MKPVIDAVVFDLGGVLVDWNPRYLYRKMFATEQEIEDFLSTVCTSEWNECQDEGRSIAEGTEMLVRAHPEYESQIRAYYGRWQEMLGGVITGTLAVLEELSRAGVPLYALTNWSSETFPIALERYAFLKLFSGIVVSGTEKDRKPFASFFRLLVERYGLTASRTLFIDDNARNVAGAEAAGLHAIHFQSPGELRRALEGYTINGGVPGAGH